MEIRTAKIIERPALRPPTPWPVPKEAMLHLPIFLLHRRGVTRSRSMLLPTGLLILQHQHILLKAFRPFQDLELMNQIIISTKGTISKVQLILIGNRVITFKEHGNLSVLTGSLDIWTGIPEICETLTGISEIPGTPETPELIPETGVEKAGLCPQDIHLM